MICLDAVPTICLLLLKRLSVWKYIFDTADYPQLTDHCTVAKCHKSFPFFFVWNKLNRRIRISKAYSKLSSATLDHIPQHIARFL